VQYSLKSHAKAERFLKSDVISDVYKSKPLQQTNGPMLGACDPVPRSRSFTSSDMLNSGQAVSGVADDACVGS